MPRDTFTVNDDIFDKNGKLTKKQNRTVKEITIDREPVYNSIRGWSF